MQFDTALIQYNSLLVRSVNIRVYQLCVTCSESELHGLVFGSAQFCFALLCTSTPILNSLHFISLFTVEVVRFLVTTLIVLEQTIGKMVLENTLQSELILTQRQ